MLTTTKRRPSAAERIGHAIGVVGALIVLVAALIALGCLIYLAAYLWSIR